MNNLEAEIERLNCALTISRGKHENAIREIERLQANLEHYEETLCDLHYKDAEIERLRVALEREQAYTAHLLGECPPDCKNCGE